MKRLRFSRRLPACSLLCLLLIVLWQEPGSPLPAATRNPVAQAQTAPGTALQYYPLPRPIRLFDTRAPIAGFPACEFLNQPLAGGGELTKQARITCDGLTIPASAQAVTGNVTIVSPSAEGFATLWPDGQSRPPVANLNFVAGQIVANAFTVRLSNDGNFKIYSTAAAHFVVDIAGYFAPPGAGGLFYHPLPRPIRLFDTRAPIPGFAACEYLNQPLVAGGELVKQARVSCAGLTIPADALAVTGNAAAIHPAGGGFITLWPNGQPRPPVSNLNYAAGQVLANAFTVGLGGDGQFRVYSLAGTHFTVDVTGYYSASPADANGAGLLYAPLPRPIRLFDTRAPIAGFPACEFLNQPLRADAELVRQARITCDGQTIPAAAQAITGNAAAIHPATDGFITLWPNGQPRPPVSNLNYAAGQIVPNAFTVGLSGDGRFRVYSLAEMHFVADVSGYFVPAMNQPPQVQAGADQTISLSATANLNGTVTDDGLPSGGALTASWSKVSGPGEVTFGNANQPATTAQFSSAGVYVLRLTAGDGELSAGDDLTITVNNALAVNAGADQVVTLPNTATLLGAATGGGGTLSVAWSQLSGAGTVLFSNASGPATTAVFPAAGVYVLRLTATDSGATGSDDVQVTVNADPTPLPPDPATVAPPINPTVTTTLGAATEFLYTGANPIQTGVAPGTIRPTRAAVLRGRALTRSGAPLPGVKITVLNHPEFGWTLSRADGAFDLAVNGDDWLTVRYEKPGFLEAQRRQKVVWQNYSLLPDVVLIGHDSRVTHIDLDANLPMQSARANPVADDSGARQATLLFAQGTTATMIFPNGSMQGLSDLHVRATEFTAGQNGAQAMPGVLPPTSAYTYAVEFNADEAVVAGARHVVFNQPVISYMENFLNLPAGTIIPAGSYDRADGGWTPEENGRVVRVLNIISGVANLDVTGNGQPASDAEYAALGITPVERQQLTALYQAGQSLWRTPILHFTAPWDFNFAGSPEPGAGAPPGDPNKPQQSDESCEETGSIIECQNQVLRERLPVTGTPFTLNYRSNRVPAAGKSIEIAVSGATVPAGLKRIELEIFIAGRRVQRTFPAAPNQSFTFIWDGRDVYSRVVQGSQPATVRIGYVYDGFYQLPEGTARAFARYPRLPLTQAHSTRNELAIFQQFDEELFNQDTRASDLGAWTLDAHHAYDPISQVLHFGDGTRRSTAGLPQVITTVAGGGAESCSPAQPCGDGGSAIGATVDAQSIAADGAGNLYLADTFRNRIRKVDAAGIITTVAGTGLAGFSGDGGAATQARLNFPSGIAVDAQGNLFIADQSNHRIRKVSAAGIISTVAGTGARDFGGDEGPATQARLNLPRAVAVASDGRLFIADFGNNRIRGISPDGVISTVVHDIGLEGSIEPTDVTLDGEGNLFFASTRNNRVRRLAPDGRITTVAGGGNNTADGIPATAAALQPNSIAADRHGNLFISDAFARRIRKVDARGIINTVAGGGAFTAENTRDGLAAAGAAIVPQYLTVDERDNLLFSDRLTSTGLPIVNRIRKLGAALPQFNGSTLTIAAEDGSLLYQFDQAGRHLLTLNALTGATVYTFGYDSAGRLSGVTDGDNNVTAIERNADGRPTAIIAPFGQRTTFVLDGNGYLAQIANPAGEAYRMTYSAEGLLRSFTDPRNNVAMMDYDAQGRLRRDEDAAGGFSTLARAETANGFSVSLTTALNRATSYQVERTATGDNRQTTISADGLQTQATSAADGRRTALDADGTLTTVASGADPRWGLQAPTDALLSIRTPSGLTNTATHTRTATIATPGDPFSATTLTSTLNENGRSYTSVYNAASRTFAIATPQGRQATRTVNAQDRVTQQQFANLAPSSFIYDAQGRLRQTTTGTGAEARSELISYNGDGFRETLTDPMGRVRSLLYDAAGRIRQVNLPGSRSVAYSYDAAGNVASITPPGRPAHGFTYTPNGLLAGYTPPNVGAGANRTIYAYNLDRQLTRITRPDNQTLDFGYNSAGRLATLTIPDGQYVYAYHPATGKLDNIAAPGGGSVSYSYDGLLLTGTAWAGAISGQVSRTYDNDFRIASLSVNGGNAINFQYDNDGLLTVAGSLSLTRDPRHGLIAGSTLGNLTDARGYNGFAELTNYNAAHGGASLYAATYVRDKLGRVTQKTETIGGATEVYDYGYDPAGRLDAVQKNGVTTATYTYDGNGNRLSYTGNGSTVTGVYDHQDRLTQYGATGYAYTADGELMSKTTGGRTTGYHYDALGNLRTVTLPDNTQIEYLIDGRNRRIGKRVNGAPVQGLLYQNQLNPIAELDGNNNVVSRFVYGSRGNVPDYMLRGGVAYRILSDHRGSVRLVVNAATGAIAQRLDYDEFGAVLADTNPGFQPFGFSGGLYDPQTKLVRFGARDYDAETGRWTTKDPLLLAGGLNVYAYAENDPINLSDSTGFVLDPIRRAKALNACRRAVERIRRAWKAEDEAAERAAREAQEAFNRGGIGGEGMVEAINKPGSFRLFIEEVADTVVTELPNILDAFLPPTLIPSDSYFVPPEII